MRLPDFVLIGAMKAGTTSLHEWLAAQPEVWMVPEKEPHFFSHDWVWDAGVPWYASRFRDAPEGALLGESSTSYTDPAHYPQAPERLAEVLAGATLLYVVRHPIERLRSDYRHQAREGRIRVTLPEELRDPDSGPVRRSLYFHCLTPYLDRFPATQVHVIRFEDLVGHGPLGWDAVLASLGLPPRPAPGTVHNAAATRPNAPGLKRVLRRAGLLERLPPPLRRAASAALRRAPAGRLVASADEPIPLAVADRIWEDVARLETWLGCTEPLWVRDR